MTGGVGEHPTEPGRRHDEDLLIRSDSLLSLIRYREATSLSDQTVRDLDALLGPLRQRTNAIIANRRAVEGTGRG